MKDSRTAPLPFDDFSLPSGGVILKSSDGVEFKVYKNILALASPFFRQMFTLPQASQGDDEEKLRSDSDADIIDVTETSSTLQILLKLIYPVVPPVFPGTESDGTIKDAKAFVDGINPVLAAALKYEMEIIVKSLLKKLIDAAETSLPDGSVIDDTLALRVFVLACKHGLKDEARDAIHASLKGCVVDNFISDLRDISAARYFYMIKHHTFAVQIARQTITLQLDHNLLPSPYKKWASCDSSSCGQKTSPLPGLRVAPWWIKFSSDAKKILAVSPRSTKIFTPAYIQTLHSKLCDYNNNECSCQNTARNWGTVSQYIRDLGDNLEQSISKNTICVDEF